MNVFFTSDTHYGHRRVIEHAKRPYQNLEEMENAFVENWNRVVTPGDVVYHLGDFHFGKRDDVERVLRRLNGTKLLVPGNHDKSHVTTAKGWASVSPLRDITVDGHPVTLCHYGMRVWNKSHYGAIQLYGHSHGSLPGNSQSMDVGVDTWNFTPVTLAQVRERLATLPPFGQPDYHFARMTEPEEP